MQPAVALAEEHQGVVSQGEERPLECGEDRELVVRPLDGGGRGTHGQHLLARVVRAASHQDVRDVPRLQRLDIRPGEVAAVAAHPLEEEAHVPGLHRDRLAPVALADLPAALRHQPVHEGRDRVGIGLLDAEVRYLLPIAVNLRRRQGHHRGLPGDASPERIERDVARLRPALHLRRETGVHGLLDGPCRAEAGAQMQELRPAGAQELLHVLVESDVRPAEAVDGLLRVAHHEQLSRGRAGLAPLRGGGIVGGDEQQDLSLQRIGVLELVHQHVGEAAGQLGANGGVVPHQVARAQEQVEEIQASRALLQGLIGLAERPQLLAQTGGDVRIAAVEEGLQLRLRCIPPGEDGGLLQVLREPLAATSPVPQPPPGKLVQLGLQPIGVARTDGLSAAKLGAPARDLRQGLHGPVVGALRFPGDLAHLGEEGHHLLQPRRPIERLAPPGAREVAVLGEIAPRLAQELARREIAGAHLAAQQPAHAHRRVRDGALEPGVESLVEEALLLLAGGHLEDRIHLRLHRPLAQQVGAEGMDGADRRCFQPLQGRGEPVALFRACSRPRHFQIRPKPELHLAGGEIGEGDRENAIERGAPAAHQGDDARHQLGGLAGARRGLDDEGGVEIAPDPLPGSGVGELRHHGIPRRCTSGASASAGLRRVRAHSEGPHTSMNLGRNAPHGHGRHLRHPHQAGPR